MLANAELVAFVPTRDLSRARTFYESVLGLEVTEANEFAVVCDADGTQLRVTWVRELTAAPFTVLGWRVANIAERVAALRAAGVAMTRYDGLRQDEHGLWTAPSGTQIAWFTDPDGNTLSLQQEATA